MASPLSLIPPPEFVQRVKALGGSDWDVRWNTSVQRWEFVSNSSANTPVSQFYGWSNADPDPVTGVLPFRDIHDTDAQAEILLAMEQTFLGNRHNGHASWHQRVQAHRIHNKGLDSKSAQDRATLYADLIHEVNLSRRWKKDHVRNTGPKVTVGA